MASCKHPKESFEWLGVITFLTAINCKQNSTTYWRCMVCNCKYRAFYTMKGFTHNATIDKIETLRLFPEVTDV